MQGTLYNAPQFILFNASDLMFFVECHTFLMLCLVLTWQLRNDTSILYLPYAEGKTES